MTDNANNNHFDSCQCDQPDTLQTIKDKIPGDEIIYDLADFFKVFGDSTRVKILSALLCGELCVGHMAEILNLSQSAISHQLRILRQNDLVKFRKEGKTVYYSLDDTHVATVLEQGLSHMLHKKIYE